MTSRRILIGVIAPLLALCTAALRADSIAELERTKAHLEEQRDQWRKDVDKFQQRLSEVKAQHDELAKAPEKVKELTEKAQKSLVDVATTAGKGIPTGINGSDVSKAKLGAKLVEKQLKANNDLDATFQAETELLDGTVDQKIAALSQKSVDLTNKIAIYNAFISGVQTNIQQVNVAITTQRTQAWNQFLGNLSQAQSAAQGRVDARHAAERQAAEKAANDSKSSDHDGHEGKGARDVPKDGPKNDGPKSDGPKNDGPKNDGPKNNGPKGDGPKIGTGRGPT